MWRIAILFLIVSSVSCVAENKFINNYVFAWCEKDPDAIELYLIKASAYPYKNPTAAYILGSLYIDGTVLPRDLKKADLYITMAANANLPEAINSLGDAYYSGDIREKNLGRALACYEKAASLCFVPAMFNAGVVLLRHIGTTDGLKRAILYLDKVAKNSDDLKDSALRYKKEAEDKLRNNKKD